MFDVNLTAVIVLAIAHLLFGSLWYSPLVFGTTWMEAKGLKKEEEETPSFCAKTYSGAFFVALFTSLVLAQFISMTEVDTLIEGAKIGVMAWLGFVATTQLSCVLWEQCPLRIFLINTGMMLISLSVMGAVLAVWQ